MKTNAPDKRVAVTTQTASPARPIRRLLVAASITLVAFVTSPDTITAATLTRDNTTNITQATGSAIELITSDADTGIQITNSGNLTVTSTNAENEKGISAEINNTASTENILIGYTNSGSTAITGTISIAGAISHGISTKHSGTGTTKIYSAANISAEIGNSNAITATSGGDIEIVLSGGTLTASSTGIFATLASNAGGNISIQIEEGVTLNGYTYGIQASADTVDWSEHSIRNDGDINSKTRASIQFNSTGKGFVSITNRGRLTGDHGIYVQSQNGIRIENDGIITADNTAFGIYAQNSISGNIVIENSNAITSGIQGIYAASETTDLSENSVHNTGSISSGGEGILFSSTGNGSVGISNLGKINSTSTGIQVESKNGIQIANSGEITSENGNGIYAKNNDTGNTTIENNNTITCGANGIYASSTSVGGVDITNRGEINSYYACILAESNHGIRIENHSAIATSTAHLMNIYGISATNDDSGSIVVENRNTITSFDNGINARNFGNGDIIITNIGDITSNSTYTSGIYAASFYEGTANVNITIENNGSINANFRGIYASQYSAGTITVTNTGNITCNDDYAKGIYANSTSTGTGNIIIKNDATITTSGEEAHGIFGEIENTDSSGNITINTTAGAVTTSKKNAHAIYATTSGIGTITVTNAATLKTNGDESHGIYATIPLRNEPSGANMAAITIENNAPITTNGNNTYGIYGIIENANSAGNVTVTNNATGIITINGGNSYGIYASTSGTGNITVTNNATITTQNGAYGIYVSGNDADNVSITNNGVITTDDESAVGIYITATHAASITIQNSADITTTGNWAHGIYVLGYDHSGSAIGAPVSGTTSTITTSGESAYGIYLTGAGAHFSSLTENTIVTTSGNYAYGLHTEHSAVMTLKKITIITNGMEASALLASDGGVISLTDFSVTTNGAAAIELHSASNESNNSVILTKSTTGNIDAGDGEVIRMEGNGIVSLVNLGNAVTNGDTFLRAILMAPSGNTLSLVLINTNGTGDVVVGNFESDGTFTEDVSLWSTTTEAEKSTFNIDLKNNAELHIKRVTSDAYEFVHAITSDATSTLKISLADAITRAISDPNEITITSDAADFMNANFLGTFAIGTGSFLLENPTAVTSGGDESQGAINVRALANAAAVRLDAGSVVTVTGLVNDGSATEVTYFSDNKSKVQNAGGAAFSTLEFNGGTLVFNSVITGALTSENFLVTEKITAGTGAVRVDLSWTTPLETASPLAANVAAILDQQKIVGDYNFIQLAKADDVTVGVGAVTLQNIDGTAVTAHAEHSGISLAQNGEIVATADYAYALASTIDNANHDGIYVGYRLATLHILDEKTLVIDNAESTNNVLDTQILSDGENRTGALQLLDSSGSGLIINNANNDTASITIGAGTVTIGYENGLGATRELVVASDATLNVNNTSLAIDGTIFVNENATITGGDGVRAGDGGHVTIAGDVVVDGGKITGGNGANSGGDVFLNGQTTLFNKSEITGGLGNNGVRGNINNTGTVIISDPVSGSAAQTTVTFTGENFRNNGAIYFPTTNNSARQNGSETTLKIVGNYHGDGGQIHLNAWHLGENKNVVDQLRITGDATGETAVTITGHAGNGAKTEGEGILVITVVGTSSDDAFSLANTLTAGFHTYELAHGDGDQNWYLRSTKINSSGNVILTGAAAASVAWFSANDNLIKRLGDLRLNQIQRDLLGSSRVLNQDVDFWVRTYGQQNNINLGNGIAESRVYTYGADVGADKAWQLDNNATLLTGAFVGYVGNRNEVRDNSGARSKLNGVQAGFYASYLDANGFYADLVGKGMYGETKIKNAGNGDYDSYGLGASLEAGWYRQSEKGWFVEPSLMAAYMHAFNETYDVDSGLRIRMQDADISQYTALVRFGKVCTIGETAIQPYAKVGYMYQKTWGGRVAVLDGSWRPTTDGSNVILGTGINWQVTAATQIHFDYEMSFGEKNDKPWGINLGMTTRW